MKSVIFKMTENEFRRNFGDTLGRIMTEKNISQLTLANDIGVTRMTIANWLAGKNTPDLFHSYLVSFSPKVESIADWYTYYGTDISGKIFVIDTIWPMLFGYDEPYNVAVTPRQTEDMTRAGKKTADILNDYIGANKSGMNNMGEDSGEEDMSSTLKYRSEDLLEKAKALQEVSASTSQQLIWIASISLIVGGIGVMNTFLSASHRKLFASRL